MGPVSPVYGASPISPGPGFYPAYDDKTGAYTQTSPVGSPQAFTPGHPGFSPVAATPGYSPESYAAQQSLPQHSPPQHQPVPEQIHEAPS
jgi:hypothetical protein